MLKFITPNHLVKAVTVFRLGQTLYLQNCGWYISFAQGNVLNKLCMVEQVSKVGEGIISSRHCKVGATESAGAVFSHISNR